MKIIIGLGNPGKEYDKTRHNVGWLFLEYLEKKYELSISKKLCDSLVDETTLFGHKVVIAKPQTYMNLSGNAVQKLKNWYKIDNKDMLIIFDDIDIPFGTIRYRNSGSGGTHNGMKNVVQMLSSTQIPRIRIGLGGLKHERQEMINFVLEKFSKEELKQLEEQVLSEAEEKLKDFLDK